jgi:hypothetical protein
MGEPRNVTRRALLGGMAAAGAASLVRPAAGLAQAALPAGPNVFSSAVGTLWGRSRPILAARAFALAGVEWSGPAGARIELRAQARDGRWSAWVDASSLGHDPDRSGRTSALFGEPVWTGPAVRVQLRSDRRVAGVRVHFVSVESAPAARVAQALPLAQPLLAAGPGQPPIIARRAWAQGQAPPGHPPEYGTVKLAFVHHTVNANGYGPGAVPSLLRGIFDYHRYVRGYFDIAYNFVIDAFGRIWEGRAGGIDMAVMGAHAGGFNLESTGVAMLGDFMNVLPSPAAISALRQLLAWKLSLHGLPALGRTKVVVDPGSAFYTPFAPGAHVSLPRIAGHRDGDTTECPGNALYGRLPAIRRRVAALAGTPARLTIPSPLTIATAGVPMTISGLLQTLAAAPLAGAPIEIQQLGAPINGTRAQTIATATTAPDGTWSVSLAFTQNVALRALHRPAPAAVADWQALLVAPALTLTVQSTSPLLLSGTVSPSMAHVIVDLYPPGVTSGKPLRKTRVATSLGSFTATLTPPGPGDYVLVARTKADAVNVAGASPPVPVSIT